MLCSLIKPNNRNKQIIEKPTERYLVVPSVILNYDYNLFTNLIVQFRKKKAYPLQGCFIGNFEKGRGVVFNIHMVKGKTVKLHEN